MTQEEKAKRYDGNYKAYIELINRLEDVKEAIKKQNYGIAMDVLCKSYPEFQVTTHSELKESEDERIRKELLQIVKENEDSFYMVMTPNKREKLIAWLEKKPSLLTKEKALKNSPFVEQKPAWSEEDEDYRLNANVAFDDYFEKEYAGALRNWLKSLKDRYTWKPSDEQIYWIKWVAYRLPNTEKSNNAKAVLEELLEQLNKL